MIDIGKVKLGGYAYEHYGHKWIPQETTSKEPKVYPKCKKREGIIWKYQKKSLN